MKLINNHRQPITLDGGTVLAAAGTPGSQKEVPEISDRDRRRHVATGRIAIVEEQEAQVTKQARISKEEAK
jgi:hypothetical protein